MRLFLAAAVLAVSLAVVPTAAASPVTITYSIEGIVGANGWYRGSSYGNNVVLHWYISGATGIDCVTIETIPGPTTGTTRSCTAWNPTDRRTITTNPIKIDASPPTGVVPRTARTPDHNGWYNHPVGVTWTGTDATSGVAACSFVNYAGPAGASAPIRGGCTDKAGNSTSRNTAINYDATPPSVSQVTVASTPNANIVRWASTDPAASVVLRRAPRAEARHVVAFHAGGSSFVDKHIRAGIEYVYTLGAVDQAGNASAELKVAGLPKVLTLRKTPYVPRAAPEPILRWQRVRGARYYHVQLFRGRKRILAAWPLTHRFAIPAAWKWNGRRYHLSPGNYHWYVWAGIGARSFARYQAIGSAKFIVPRAHG
jgi:hypothetical protein